MTLQKECNCSLCKHSIFYLFFSQTQLEQAGYRPGSRLLARLPGGVYL